MSVRPLSAGETALARAAFGDAVPYGLVRIHCGARGNPLAAIAFRAGNWAITLRRSIHYAREHYRDDFAAAGPDEAGLLLHELTHVWQYRALGVPRFLARYGCDLAACRFRPRDAYLYGPASRFAEAKLEAQAQMVGDYCAARLRGDAAAAARIARNLAGSGLYGL